MTIENLHIRHAGGKGIALLNSNDIRIKNVVIESADAPATGPHSSSERENIYAYRSNKIQIENVRLYRGSTGIYLLESEQARISAAYGEDFRGPYPLGQFIQLNRSDDALIDGFYTVSKPTSWPEDNINIYRSKRALIRSGLIDGNNAPNGVGIMFDGGTSTGRVEDVDTIRMGNGSFSAYDGTNDVTFLRTRSRDDICSDQGRGLPSSGGSMWTAHPRLSTVTVIDSTYFNPCAGVIWPMVSFARVELKQETFAPRKGIAPRMCWEAI